MNDSALPSGAIQVSPATGRWYGLALDLLPVTGVLLLGWSAEAAVYFIWLDLLLANLQLIVPAVVITERKLAQALQEEHPTASRLGAWIGLGIAAAGFCVPAWGLGIVALQLMAGREKALAATLLRWDTVFASLLDIGLRIRDIRGAARSVADPAGSSAFTLRAPTELMHLMMRAAALILLAYASSLLGRAALVAFLLAAAALQSCAGSRGAWLQQAWNAVKKFGGD